MFLEYSKLRCEQFHLVISSYEFSFFCCHCVSKNSVTFPLTGICCELHSDNTGADPEPL